MVINKSPLLSVFFPVFVVVVERVAVDVVVIVGCQSNIIRTKHTHKYVSMAICFVKCFYIVMIFMT